MNEIMFYLMSHSAHFAYSYTWVRHMFNDHTVIREEGRNALFKDAHNTFYSYTGIGHMVKNHRQ